MTGLRALDRAVQAAGVPGLSEILAERLSNSGLTTLLLDVYRRRVATARPSELLAQVRQNRFVLPAAVDPIALREAEIRILRLARDAGFQPIEPSPVAALGSSAIYGRVSQDKVLTALRGCEVVSDSSSAMILQMTRRIVDDRLTGLDQVASQRNVRCSPLGPGMYAHFQLVAVASVHRELHTDGLVALVLRHLRLQAAVYAHFGLPMELVIRPKPTRRRLGEAVIAALGEFPHTIAGEAGSDYYEGVQIKTYGTRGDARLELGDCGFVSWPRALSGDARLSGFISGLGLERLLLG